MTTEDDFQRALDANPDDWQTRLVLADFLEERGDTRAEGYRILGTLRIYPSNAYKGQSDEYWAYAAGSDSPRNPNYDFCRLPTPIDYRDLVRAGGRGFTDVTRRRMEDVAALAIVALPAARRAELLQLASA